MRCLAVACPYTLLSPRPCTGYAGLQSVFVPCVMMSRLAATATFAAIAEIAAVREALICVELRCGWPRQTRDSVNRRRTPSAGPGWASLSRELSHRAARASDAVAATDAFWRRGLSRARRRVETAWLMAVWLLLLLPRSCVLSGCHAASAGGAKQPLSGRAGTPPLCCARPHETRLLPAVAVARAAPVPLARRRPARCRRRALGRRCAATPALCALLLLPVVRLYTSFLLTTLRRPCTPASRLAPRTHAAPSPSLRPGSSASARSDRRPSLRLWRARHSRTASRSRWQHPAPARLARLRPLVHRTQRGCVAHRCASSHAVTAPRAR
jgi:hypothetical protein